MRRCEICDEERQFVGHSGQQWTTTAEMRQQGARNTWTEARMPGQLPSLGRMTPR